MSIYSVNNISLTEPLTIIVNVFFMKISVLYLIDNR